MPLTIPCQAIVSGRRVQLSYDGYDRVIEVHAAGYTKQGNPVMRVWQVRGGSSSGEVTGWKLMRLDQAESLLVIDEESEAPRPGYKKGDSAMAQIAAEV